MQVYLLTESEPRARAQALLAEHNYLGGVKAVGEQLHYAVSGGQGEWLAVLIFAAAAFHLRERDRWGSENGVRPLFVSFFGIASVFGPRKRSRGCR